MSAGIPRFPFLLNRRFGIAREKQWFMFRTINIRIPGMLLSVIVVSVSTVGCSEKRLEDQEGREEMAAPTIEAVLKEHTDRWMSIPGVVGTGIGECEGKPCIRIFVAKKTPELLQKIPSKLEGFVVDVEETGAIRARDST